jgi:ferredoxin, 2Fe-2S
VSSVGLGVGVVVIDAHQGVHRLTGRSGDTLMHVARLARLPVLGECNASMACATCHVVVDAMWSERLDPPSETEEDTLDTVFNLQPTSRLSCQIKLTPALDGLSVRLPE